MTDNKDVLKSIKSAIVGLTWVFWLSGALFTLGGLSADTSSIETIAISVVVIVFWPPILGVMVLK